MYNVLTHRKGGRCSTQRVLKYKSEEGVLSLVRTVKGREEMRRENLEIGVGFRAGTESLPGEPRKG